MRALLVALNVLLGPTVLASYVWSARTYPDQLEPLWGGVPESVRGLYTANMFLAAAGYLVFTWLFVLRTDHATTRYLGGKVSSAILPVAYGAVLIGSIVWMPLTAYALDRTDAGLVPLIVLDLAIVAAGSLALLACALTASPRPSPRLRLAAIVGALFFCLQTVVLDATVWTLNFEIDGPIVVEPAPQDSAPRLARSGARDASEWAPTVSDGRSPHAQRA